MNETATGTGRTARDRARELYLNGNTPGQIAVLTGVSINTIYTWRRRDEWQNYSGTQRAFEATLSAYMDMIRQSPDSLSDRQLVLLEHYAGLLATLGGSGDLHVRK